MEGWQRAFVLHSRPWSETSLVLDVFTEESGRVRLVAKGARSKRSNLKGALQPLPRCCFALVGVERSNPA
jgi:DNA repair protein RecO (recombination protein O)